MTPESEQSAYMRVQNYVIVGGVQNQIEDVGIQRESVAVYAVLQPKSAPMCSGIRHAYVLGKMDSRLGGLASVASWNSSLSDAHDAVRTEVADAQIRRT